MVLREVGAHDVPRVLVRLPRVYDQRLLHSHRKLDLSIGKPTV
jgi:hypothetical protein